tara:strand:- start:204 stop:407 length:204 start_codon:yes stop_codon:yes gene_type:complete
MTAGKNAFSRKSVCKQFFIVLNAISSTPFKTQLKSVSVLAVDLKMTDFSFKALQKRSIVFPLRAFNS